MEFYHENTGVLHLNTEPNRNYYIPFTKGTDPFAWREESERFHLLNGQWDFKYFSDFRDYLENENVVYTDKITVPGNWQLQSFDHPDYVNTRYPIPYDPPFVPDENPCGVYHRTFDVTLKEGTDFLLNFEGVDSCFYLYVNGDFAGYSQVSHMTHEFNITKYLKNGQNELKVVVLKWCDGTYLECQDKWRMSGIFRDVFILERPVNRIRNYKVETTNEGEVKISLDCTGLPGKVKAEISDTDGNVLAFSEAGVSENSENVITLNVQNPVLWNAEAPYLYSLVLETEDEIIGEKVGFRKIEILNRSVCVNGTPIKIKGTNRHESHPETGFYVPRDFARMELELMKEHNINAIRTSHYPPAPWFLQLCDEMGFYVIDEADNEAHGSVEVSHTVDNNWDYSGICYLANEPGFAEPILDRVQMMVARDVNRPCVVFWSLGNEAGYAKSFEAAARWAKANGTGRLVHYESMHHMDCFPIAEDSPETLDVVSRMYSSPDWIENDFLKDEKETRPFMMCEYCHAMGNGPGDLEDYWQIIYKHDRLAGGLIWEWCDHGLKIGEDANGKPKFAYGGDFNELIHDGNFVMDGLVYPDRRPHTGLKEAKNVYRPVRCELVDAEKGIFRFSNKLDFLSTKDALEFIKYKVSENGMVLSKGRKRTDIPAKTSSEIQFPGIAEILSEITSKKEHGEVLVLFEYEAKGKPDFILGFDQIKLCEKAAASPVQKMASGEVSVQESSRKIRFSGNSFTYVFDKRLAQFTSLVFDGAELLDKALEYNAFRAPTDNDCNVKRDWYKYHLQSEITKVYSVSVEGNTIRTETSLGWLIYKNTFCLVSEYTVSGDGTIRFKSNVKVMDKREYLPRFGLRFFLNKSFSDVIYYGYGPHESYEDKHRSTYKAIFGSKVADQYEPYVRPQENSSHFGTSFVSVENEKLKLTVTSPKDFSFNVSEYSQEELSGKGHDWELEKSGSTILCTDYKMSGVGSNSCGPYLAEKYQFNEKEFNLDFTMKIERK